MKTRRLFAAICVLLLCFQCMSLSDAAQHQATERMTQKDVTAAILALQVEFPEGRSWNNQTPNPSYVWTFPGSIVSMSGCAAFAAILQDRVFGSIKEAPVTWQRISGTCTTKGMRESTVPYSWESLWPGDILQFSGHTVLVLQKYDDRITVAEGNYGGSVHWGRSISKASVSSASYVLTRYSKTESQMLCADLPPQSHWSYSAVCWALERGIAAPISETCFAPNAPCSRADMILFLWAAFGRPEPEAEALPFADVSASALYYPAVQWALQQHITAGTDAASFSPDRPCTRAQAMTFLWRASGSPSAELLCFFCDVRNEDYFSLPVAWAAARGITSGTTTTSFSPDRTITRAEALAFLYRTMTQ